jgi:hypothetical protein
MANHAYNDPSLSPQEFLEALYRDPTVRLKHRIQAASLLRQIYNASLPQVVIRIGGFPEYITASTVLLLVRGPISSALRRV